MITPAFGVYVHWPFCAAKCPYCDFNSHVRFGGVDEPRFLSGLLRELDHAVSLTGKRDVSSVFFGGGTPSLMAPSTVGAILDHIGKVYNVLPGAEVTLEANPSSVEAERFRGYRTAGVNRVSLGVQSLRDEELRKLGRIHSVAEAKAAISIAAKTFDRFTFDLIYARPGQLPEQWRAELAEGLELAGSHMSLYQLTIEPETPFAALFAAGKLIIPDPDAALVLYDITQEMTARHGLPLYEISNHAAAGQESQHNLIYWRYGEYVGIGPGAHGRIIVGGIRHATTTLRNPEGWLARVELVGHGYDVMTPLTPAEQADEALLMGLRLVEGLDLARLERVGGLRPCAAAIEELVVLGMLEHMSASRIRATGQGRFILNAVVAKLSQGFEATPAVDLVT
jgi:putative oxygen-independent coproporphyrinogen III oxidase